jgi:hypothetical protein
LDFAERAGLELPEESVLTPVEIVRLALDGLEAGSIEILDPLAAEAKAALSGPPRALALVAPVTERNF